MKPGAAPPAVLSLLLLLLPAPARAQGQAAATGTGGVLQSVQAMQKSLDAEWTAGPYGRIAMGAIGVVGLGYAARYGAVGAFQALSGQGPALAADVAGDGSVSAGAGDAGSAAAAGTSASAIATTSTK